MADHLSVDPSELIRAAQQHEERMQGWHAIGASPPNDPDALAAELGFVGHQVTEGLRVDNARRALDAQRFADEHADLAENLRGAAADYRRADQAGADTIGGFNFPD